MKIYPAIDIKDGSCVRLYKGNFTKKTVYNKNPFDVAKSLEMLGCRYLHIVNLDGTLGIEKNEECIKNIILNTNLKVELGGGINSYEVAKKWIDFGVDRVIIGSKIIRDYNMVIRMLKEFGKEKIVIGIDVFNGYIAIDGWKTITDFKAIDLCKTLKKDGFNYIIYTDITKDGTLEGPNLVDSKKIIDETGLLVTVSGGISSNNDIYKVRDIGAYGVIVGKAYYSGNVKLEEIDITEE